MSNYPLDEYQFILEELDSSSHPFTDWERDFIIDVSENIERLQSEKVRGIIDDLYDRYIRF